MGSKSKGTTYTSKGQRPSVSRSTRLAVRRERRANLDMESISAKSRYRELVMSKKGDSPEKKKILEQERVESLASQLYEQYGKAGATWASAVQAVKTDWISEYHRKWSNRLNNMK